MDGQTGKGVGECEIWGGGGWININVFRTFTVAFFGRGPPAPALGEVESKRRFALLSFRATSICFGKF